MSYSQITQEERYRIHGLRNQGWCPAAIAREVGRHRSTIGREFERNGRRPLAYEPYRADCRAKVRRAWSRRNRRVTPRDCARVVRFLKADWSPEQIAGRLRRRGRLRICHATIYHYIWQDRAAGGELYRLLRTGGRRRARYGSRIHRGRRILGRSIATRPARIEQRQQLGHWEVDPIAGGQELASALTLVERKTGYVLIGALRSKTAADFARRTIALGHERPLLLRPSLPRLGAGHQREPQWAHSPIPAEAEEHGRSHATRLRGDRPQAQHPPSEAARLPHPGGMLCSLTDSVALQT
jgi:IS30 family transposase